jgi:acyl dehydratase
VNCDVNFGLPGYWIQDTGWLSVSILGAVSAESCGRDSFAESAGFGQLRFGSPAKADDHQTERL